MINNAKKNAFNKKCTVSKDKGKKFDPPDGQGGDDDDDGTVVDSVVNFFFAQAVAAVGSLPTCNGDREGQIYYLSDVSEFRACTSGSWTAIDVKGPKGDKGDTGDTGPQGPAGADGVMFRHIKITRSKYSVTTSLSDKDIACSSTFGNNYETAKTGEVYFYMGRPTNRSFLLSDDDTQAYRPNSGSWSYTTSSTHPIACIYKNSPYRITRGRISSAVDDATKDSFCESEIGASFSIAQAQELGYFKGPRSANYLVVFDNFNNAYGISSNAGDPVRIWDGTQASPATGNALCVYEP